MKGHLEWLKSGEYRTDEHGNFEYRTDEHGISNVEVWNGEYRTDEYGISKKEVKCSEGSSPSCPAVFTSHWECGGENTKPRRENIEQMNTEFRMSKFEISGMRICPHKKRRLGGALGFGFSAEQR